MSTNKRQRGRKLQAIRLRHFRDNPLCVMCEAQGRVRIWTILDHIIPVYKDGPDTPDNKQGLCDECNRIKTAQDMGYEHRPKVTTGPDGWPTTGNG